MGWGVGCCGRWRAAHLRRSGGREAQLALQEGKGLRAAAVAVLEGLGDGDGRVQVLHGAYARGKGRGGAGGGGMSQGCMCMWGVEAWGMGGASTAKRQEAVVRGGGGGHCGPPRGRGARPYTQSPLPSPRTRAHLAARGPACCQHALTGHTKCPLPCPSQHNLLPASPTPPPPTHARLPACLLHAFSRLHCPCLPTPTPATFNRNFFVKTTMAMATHLVVDVGQQVPGLEGQRRVVVQQERVAGRRVGRHHGLLHAPKHVRAHLRTNNIVRGEGVGGGGGEGEERGRAGWSGVEKGGAGAGGGAGGSAAFPERAGGCGSSMSFAPHTARRQARHVAASPDTTARVSLRGRGALQR